MELSVSKKRGERPYVAVLGLDPELRFTRRFLRPERQYPLRSGTEALLCYELDDGIYELKGSFITCPSGSWRNRKQLWLEVSDGKARELFFRHEVRARLA